MKIDSSRSTRTQWTAEKLSMLIVRYPYEGGHAIAAELGCSLLAVTSTAYRKLRLKILPHVRSSIQAAASARPEVKAKQSAVQRLAQNRPEAKERFRAMINNPEVKRKRLASLLIAQKRPDVNEKRRAASIASNARPEVKEKQRSTAFRRHAQQRERERRALDIIISQSTPKLNL